MPAVLTHGSRVTDPFILIDLESERDQALKDYPDLPVYSRDELNYLKGNSFPDETIKLIHLIKRTFDGVLTRDPEADQQFNYWDQHKFNPHEKRTP